MDGAPGADTEIEWQLDAQDLAVVQGWIEKAAAAGQEGGVSITPAKTINHVDTYLDTEDRRLDRAGYSVRLRKSRRHPTEATLKSLDGARSDALGVRRELAEDIEGDDPATVASTEGPVGARVRALVGSRKLVPVFDLQTRRRVYELANGETPSGELLLDETAIREPDGRLLSRLRRVEIEVPEPAVDAVAPLVESLQRACGLQPAGLSKYEAALAASGSERAEPESFGRTEIDPRDSATTSRSCTTCASRVGGSERPLRCSNACCPLKRRSFATSSRGSGRRSASCATSTSSSRSSTSGWKHCRSRTASRSLDCAGCSPTSAHGRGRQCSRRWIRAATNASFVGSARCCGRAQARARPQLVPSPRSSSNGDTGHSARR